MNDQVVAIVSAFFVIGIVVGVITVIALSARRAYRSIGRGYQGDRPEYGLSGPSERDREVTVPEDWPRWPGDDDNDFSGR
jgi:hypothetical protein